MKQSLILNINHNKYDFEQEQIYIFIKEILRCLEIDNKNIFDIKNPTDLRVELRDLFMKNNIHVIDNNDIFQINVQDYIVGTFHKPKYKIKNIDGKDKLVAEFEIITIYDDL